MNLNDAASVTVMVGQLWPNPPMNDTRAAFYAEALTAIPEPEQAIRALNRLFQSERFQPTPGEVVDVALGLAATAAAAWETLRRHAERRASRQPNLGPLDRATVEALRSIGWSVVDLPIEDRWRMEKIRPAFIEAHVANARESASTAVLDALTGDHHQVAANVRSIDTTSAAGRMT